MTDEEAIDILQNCIADYVIGDFCCGKYCPDEDMCKNDDCYYEKAIDTVINLINKQEKAIDRMSKYIEEITGSCPFDTFDYQVRDCDKECKDQMAECWKEYFMEDK